MKRIVLTGGGTAGHITPNIALMPELKKRGYRYFYIGSYDGMEKEMIESLGVRYFGISTGKLRRYFSLRNFTDPARVVKGYMEARSWLRKIRPNVVFSKGGFVSVPVVLAAHRLGIPVVIHESDMTPGLANKISLPSADAVCCNFPETVEDFPEGKAILTGSPIRQELFEGTRQAGLDFCGFSDDAATYDSYTPDELVEMGLMPDTMAPMMRDYSFTVDQGNSFAVIPISAQQEE